MPAVHPLCEPLLGAVLLLLGGSGPLAAQAPQRWTLAPELRIGSEDRPNYTLSEISDLVVGPDGAIYMAHPQERRVRQFNARGTFVRTFGRQGGGPGEFQSVDQIGWKGDSLWVADRSQYRISFFSAAGRAHGTVRAQSPVVQNTGYPTAPTAVLSDGSFAGRPTLSARSLEERSAARVPLLRMDRTGAITGRFGEVDGRGEYERVRSTRLAMNLTLPLPFHSLWDVAPDGSAVVVVHRQPATGSGRATYRVARYEPSGALVYDRVHSYTPRSVPEADRDSIHDMLADVFQRSGFQRDAQRARALARDSVPLPRFQPPVTDLAAGRDGTIWLRREALGASRVEYTVLDPDGHVLATVAVPARLRIMQAERGRVWGVETDEMDVPYVVRYRVVAGR